MVDNIGQTVSSSLLVFTGATLASLSVAIKNASS